MSVPRLSSRNQSSVPSGRVAKRGRFLDCMSIKATAISIFLSSSGIEMVKCSRCQRLQRACIVDPDHASSCSGCVKDKVKCDSVGLTVEGALRLSREIREAEADRRAAKVDSDRKLAEFLRSQQDFLEAKSRLDRLEHSEELLKNRRSELVRRGLQSLEVGADDPSITGPAVEDTPVAGPSLGLIDPQLLAEIEAEFGFTSGGVADA
jgi:hypothetical protein